MTVTDETAVDIDAAETSEWLEALDAVVAHDGADRARQIVTRVVERAQGAGTGPIALEPQVLDGVGFGTRRGPREGDVRGGHRPRQVHVGLAAVMAPGGAGAMSLRALLARTCGCAP